MTDLDFVDADRIVAIATEVFAGMVDGQTGRLTAWPGHVVTPADPLHAWVTLTTEPPRQVLLTAGAGTARDLTRALLRADAGTPLTDEDVVDAFGEIVNILGGNIKGLLPEHVELTLPQVSRESPTAGGALMLEVVLDWRGCPLFISM